MSIPYGFLDVLLREQATFHGGCLLEASVTPSFSASGLETCSEWLLRGL